jgi:hypothetical protein
MNDIRFAALFPSTFTMAALESEVRKLTADFPDAVYTRLNGVGACLYSVGSAGPGCGCIIGQGMARLGVDVKQIDETYPRPWGAASDKVLKRAGHEEARIQKWLTAVQTYQDDGNTWAQCVAHGDAVIAPVPV